MAPIEDKEYVKTCAELASCLSISLASARRKDELLAMKQGSRDMNSRKLIAKNLLNEIQTNSKAEEVTAKLDNLLEALAEEDNFMVED